MARRKPKEFKKWYKIRLNEGKEILVTEEEIKTYKEIGHVKILRRAYRNEIKQKGKGQKTKEDGL